MINKKIAGLILLAFVVGIVAGFSLSFDRHYSNKGMMRQEHFRVFDRPQGNSDYVDYDYSIQTPKGDYIRKTNQNDRPVEPVACTMEAKICPDGSSVGRQGSNCEFAPCPN